MAEWVDFLDPLGRGGKPSNIPGGIFWLNLVVLVERADPHSCCLLIIRKRDRSLQTEARGCYTYTVRACASYRGGRYARVLLAFDPNLHDTLGRTQSQDSAAQI